MTIINLVSPQELEDKHLLKEIKELPRVFTLATRNRCKFNIPEKFSLGEEHVVFFKNKLIFLYNRYSELYEEAHKRNIQVKYHPANLYFILKKCKKEFCKDWQPSEEEIELSRSRLEKKLISNTNSYLRSVANGI